MTRVMRVVVMAASKGGTGKTTLSGALAARAARDDEPTAMIDLDPLQSLSRWWELRGKTNNPLLIVTRGGVAATLDRLRREGFAWVFIDTPPSSLSTIEPVVEAGDITLIVVQPSVHDLEGVEPVVEIAKRKKKPFAFVVNRVEPRSKLTGDAVVYLKTDGRVLKEHVSNRESHKIAAIEGKSAAETKDEKAREEIEALWRAVKKMAVDTVRR